ncbi:MAG: class I SAM-dependent methyltransferase [Candidatus Infernicultor aquiphilus]|uniref:Class I SAM-dependent methyltransferase n=1 Tax=Candidatus Infernicultor aquiphilus TaxID=1805029 RepID=A0A2M7KAB5_9BACT|nr:MAG: class I SAM-dependent methyltransferase [Candidatus Atribacteria bacterium CG_4_8_14_3_um_filter_34_18]
MTIRKVDTDFIRKSFTTEKTVLDYTKAVREIGLWESEKMMIKKYFNPENRILDIGCGAGRTSIGLYKLGYHLIEGLDLSEAMIAQARRISKELKYDITFSVGDAACLDYDDETFEVALFSFNGIMQIPGKENRIKVLKEIKRILKSEGYFLFTTHDHDSGKEYESFWQEEKKKWALHIQDKSLHEFGDRVIKMEERDTFLHFPTREEVISCLKEAGFVLIERILRSVLCEESEEVKKFSTDCVLWLVHKPLKL